ncbi:hypothetical protein OUZ56_024883 [Daphnia magna]|uniref:Uncharacterized protein n=1 Tax=Daphnia magna TaxID=35525 RepID=A0ABQ9ZIA2_9CRUS|nr:hypothetical protein OUZ56_024883 [Daphnia magna]
MNVSSFNGLLYGFEWWSSVACSWLPLVCILQFIFIFQVHYHNHKDALKQKPFLRILQNLSSPACSAVI